MQYFRIMSVDYYKDPYSCSVNAGRWNPRNSRMIYAGSSPSVCLLEYLCIKGNTVGRKPWFMIVYNISDESLIGELQADALPDDWNALPHARSTQDFGQAWLQEKEFPFLMVPSARMNLSFYPTEHNLLINPEYELLRDHLQVVRTIPFNYLLNDI